MVEKLWVTVRIFLVLKITSVSCNSFTLLFLYWCVILLFSLFSLHYFSCSTAKTTSVHTSYILLCPIYRHGVFSRLFLALRFSVSKFIQSVGRPEYIRHLDENNDEKETTLQKLIDDTDGEQQQQQTTVHDATTLHNCGVAIHHILSIIPFVSNVAALLTNKVVSVCV